MAIPTANSKLYRQANDACRFCEERARHMTYEHSNIDTIRDLCDRLDETMGRLRAARESSAPEGDLIGQANGLIAEIDHILYDRSVQLSEYEHAISIAAREYDLMRDEIYEMQRDEELTRKPPFMRGTNSFRRGAVDRREATYRGQISLISSLLAYGDGDPRISEVRDDLLAWYRARTIIVRCRHEVDGKVVS